MHQVKQGHFEGGTTHLMHQCNRGHATTNAAVRAIPIIYQLFPPSVWIPACFNAHVVCCIEPCGGRFFFFFSTLHIGARGAQNRSLPRLVGDDIGASVYVSRALRNLLQRRPTDLEKGYPMHRKVHVIARGPRKPSLPWNTGQT